MPTAFHAREHRYWWTRRSFAELLVPLSAQARASVGAGVIVDTPWSPEFIAAGPFKGDSVAEATPLQAGDGSGQTQWRFRKSRTVIEQALYLNAYFSTDYALGGFEAALSYAQERRSTRDTMFLEITSKSAEPIPGDFHTTWAEPPFTEALLNADSPGDELALLAAFVETYGSHYIESRVEGWRLVWEVSVSKDRSEIRAKVEAALSSFQSKGEISAGLREVFQSEHVESNAVLVGTAVYKDSGDGYPFGGGGLDSIDRFLKDYESNKAVVYPAPISVSVRSYRTTLGDHAETARLLAPSDQGAKLGPPPVYGVPTGTVLAWIPKPEHWRPDVDGTEVIHAPEGWEFLDEALSHPETDDAFVLMGTSVDGDGRDVVGTFAGQASHTHSGRVSRATGKKENCDGGSSRKPSHYKHRHDVSIGAARNEPPHLKVFWIRKL